MDKNIGQLRNLSWWMGKTIGDHASLVTLSSSDAPSIHIRGDPRLPRKQADLPQSRIRLRSAQPIRADPGSFGEMVPLTRLLLLSGILCGLSTISIEATPASYDQRQTGEVNVDGKLENFLLLVSTSFNEGFMNILTTEAAQTLGLLAARRNAMKQELAKPSEATVYETDDKEEGREPYHVEIVRIEKDGDIVARSKQPETLNAEVTEVKIAGKIGEEASKSSKNVPEVSIDSKASEKGSRSQKSRKLIEGSKKVRIGSTVEDLGQVDDITAKEEVSKAARPGISLKKQLSKKEEEELSVLSEERNELSNKRDELVLLGDGVENCGPGRYRDKSGTCQEDKDFY